MMEEPQQHSYPIRHPYQVLRMLPKNATPAQQDSAIQATFQPSEIRYSDRPDTLHIPGHPIGKSIKDVSVPQYYNETYFKNDSLYHSEIRSNRLGVPGVSIPYRQSNDDIFSGFVMVIIIFTILVLPKSKDIIAIELKEFFAPLRTNELTQKMTSWERIVQIIFMLIGIMCLGAIFFNYVQHEYSETFILPTEYHVMGVFCLEIFAFAGIKYILTRWVNATFFPDHNRKLINDTKSFLLSLNSLLLLPLFAINIYFDLPIIFTAVWIGILFAEYEILYIYKVYSIFFRKNVLKLQIFLYLCTLELVPIVLLWGIMTLTAQTLTIKY